MDDVSTWEILVVVFGSGVTLGLGMGVGTDIWHAVSNRLPLKWFALDDTSDN